MAKTTTTNNGVAMAAQALVQDLRELAASAPRLDTRALKAPEALRSELANIGNVLKAARARGVDELDAIYSARRQSVRAVVAEREKRVRAYAKRERLVVPAEEGKFIVAGRVTDRATGVGLPNVKVNAFDLDRRYDDRLGSARTDALGYFRIEYTAADFEDLGDQKPETYVEVLDDQGNAIFTSTKSFVQKAGKAEFIAAPIDGSKMPASCALGMKISRSVDRRIATFERRKRSLAAHRATQVSEPPTPDVGRKAPAAERKARGRGVTKKKPSGRERGGPGRRGSRHSLTEVKGIGPTFAKRLVSRGITDVGEVAAMTPSRLAELLDIADTRAAPIIESARQLMKEE